MSRQNHNEYINWLHENFVAGKITRREFIAKMAALGAVAALPITLHPKPAGAATRTSTCSFAGNTAARRRRTANERTPDFYPRLTMQPSP